MDQAASLKQTVTHLFDAVRFSQLAKELEEAARSAEGKLETELNKLESHAEEISNLLDSFKQDPEPPIRELSRQMTEFLMAAKGQAREKLEKKLKQELSELRSAVSAERDKAMKSLEAYLAANPVPPIEEVVSARFVDGVYSAVARYECEGGLKYDFGLAAQNSRLFHQELTLSQLEYELKVPVRFSKILLKKERVPGFERLDQYVLMNAETSGGRIRANFQKVGNGASIKVVTSGSDDQGFVGLEYSDKAHAVNVMNDPSLSAYVDLASIRKAMGDLAKELSELAQKKVALLRFSLDGEEPMENIDCYAVLQIVLKVMGPSYRTLVSKMSGDASSKEESKGLSIGYVQDRLKVLGTLSSQVSKILGLQAPA